jgi:predicted Zn-dependent protease
VEYFRDRCLTCHSGTLEQSHAAPGRDWVACHMPRQAARDGGHTAFTDHRIRARPESQIETVPRRDLRAWREPVPSLQKRNLGLALVTLGLENGSADEALRGYRLISPIQKDLQDDPASSTTIGSLLLRAKQPAEALHLFEQAEKLRPGYAPFEVNVASALITLNQTVDGIEHLQKAIKLDPLLQSAIQLLSTATELRDKTKRQLSCSHDTGMQWGLRPKQIANNKASYQRGSSTVMYRLTGRSFKSWTVARGQVILT